jgi:hypothetical protein
MWLQLAGRFAAILLLSSCASKKPNTDLFRLQNLQYARAVLATNASPNIESHLSWPVVDGFVTRPPGFASPELWAICEIRIVGEKEDRTLCLPYLRSEDKEIRREAERSFVVLAAPDKKHTLLGLLESTEQKQQRLALVYAGWNEATISEEDLQELLRSSDASTRQIAVEVATRLSVK